MRYLIEVVLLFIINIALASWCATIGDKDEKDEPLDDSNWQTDFEKLKTKLTRFLGNNQEVIVGMLGKNNAVSDESLYEKGFCFVTDKAYYFIGKVWQKKFIFSWKSNIQHRIINTELKGIKLKTLFPWYGIIYLLYTIFNCIATICILCASYPIARWSTAYADDVYSYAFGIGCFALITILAFLIHGIVIIYAKRMTTVDLEFTDQIMCFKVNQLGKQELKTFYKAVSQVQENVNNQVGSYEPNVNNTVNSVNKVESLTEISKLHNQGLITQEEFEKLKKEVMEQ